MKDLKGFEDKADREAIRKAKKVKGRKAKQSQQEVQRARDEVTAAEEARRAEEDQGPLRGRVLTTTWHRWRPRMSGSGGGLGWARRWRLAG